MKSSLFCPFKNLQSLIMSPRTLPLLRSSPEKKNSSSFNIIASAKNQKFSSKLRQWFISLLISL